MIHMREEIIKFGAEECSRETFKNSSVRLSLEGWPCAVAVIGIGFTYAMVTKIKCDAQVKNPENTDTKRIEKVA